MSKGSRQRTSDYKKFYENYDLIFKKDSHQQTANTSQSKTNKKNTTKNN